MKRSHAYTHASDASKSLHHMQANLFTTAMDAAAVRGKSLSPSFLRHTAQPPVAWRFWCPIWIRVTRLSSEQTTWFQLHGSGSHHCSIRWVGLGHSVCEE
ncbi:hypothetical protein CsSME_00019209 [Camellia sinensis var. sinensis]